MSIDPAVISGAQRGDRALAVALFCGASLDMIA
jgi:hypothetical protein